jgi:WhiB family redox-sensing transcriptional regulator
VVKPTEMGRDVEWMRRGACLGPDPEIFFPEDRSGGRAKAQEVDEAKAVCRRCPVVPECLAWALTTPEKFGIWGGMTSNEREAVKRREDNDSDGVDSSILNSETPDELTVERLMSGERVPRAARIDIAHAAVRLYRRGGVKHAIAKQLGCDGSQVRVWAQRAERGEPLINLDWLAQQRKRAERLLEAVSA